MGRKRVSLVSDLDYRDHHIQQSIIDLESDFQLPVIAIEIGSWKLVEFGWGYLRTYEI